MIGEAERKLLDAMARAGRPQGMFDVADAVASTSGERDELVRAFLYLAIDGYVAEVVLPGEQTGDRYMPTDRGFTALRVADHGRGAGG